MAAAAPVAAPVVVPVASPEKRRVEFGAEQSSAQRGRPDRCPITGAPPHPAGGYGWLDTRDLRGSRGGRGGSSGGRGGSRGGGYSHYK